MKRLRKSVSALLIVMLLLQLVSGVIPALAVSSTVQLTDHSFHGEGLWLTEIHSNDANRNSATDTRVTNGTASLNVTGLGHSYKTVTVDATCTADGSVTETCSVCGDTKTQVIPAKGHSYENGTCTVCGAADPDYVAPIVQPTLKLKAPALEFKDMISAVPSVAKEKQGQFASNKGFSTRRPAVSFEGAFSINYFFTPNYAPVDGITLYYWTEADFNAAEVLTVENASGDLMMDGEGVGQYRGDVVGIAAKNLTEAVYVAAVYSDGTSTWTSGVLGYSIGAYCSGQAANGGTMGDLAMATAVYGYHAKAFFAQ